MCISEAIRVLDRPIAVELQNGLEPALTAGAFLLYVSVLSIQSVVVILMAAMLMFQLGVQVERRRRPVSEPSTIEMPQVQRSRITLEASSSEVCDHP